MSLCIYSDVAVMSSSHGPSVILPIPIMVGFKPVVLESCGIIPGHVSTVYELYSAATHIIIVVVSRSNTCGR